MEGAELIPFGDVTTSVMGAAVLAGSGLLFSAIVYCLMVYPSTRREEFRVFEGFSRRSAGIAAGLIFLVFSAGGYYTYLSPFFAMRLDQSQLSLHYRVPPRTVTLARGEIDQVLPRREAAKGRTRVILMVLTRDGGVYESAQLKPGEADVALRKLQAWLASTAW